MKKVNKFLKSIMKFCITILLLSLLTGNLNAQDSLNHYLKLATENNPDLKAKFYDYQAALEKIPQAGALPDPQFSFAYFIQPVETRVGPQQARISFTQMFPWFGLLQYKENAAVQEAKANYEIFNDTRALIHYQVKSAWYQLYYLNKSNKTISENIGLLNTYRELIISKIESGTASTVDELEIAMELADLQSQVDLLSDEIAYQTQAFFNLLNISSTKKLTIPDSLSEFSIPYPIEEIRQKILTSNRGLISMEHKKQQYQSEKIYADKNGLPKFSLGMDYILTGKSENPALGDKNGQDAILFPKISFNLPIYRSKYNAASRQAEMRKSAVQERKSAKTNKLKTEFEKTRKEQSDALRRMDLYTGQLNLAEKSLQLLLQHYSTMGRDFSDLLRIERRKLTYALLLEKAQTDRLTANAYFQYLMGE